MAWQRNLSKTTAISRNLQQSTRNQMKKVNTEQQTNHKLKVQTIAKAQTAELGWESLVHRMGIPCTQIYTDTACQYSLVIIKHDLKQIAR